MPPYHHVKRIIDMKTYLDCIPCFMQQALRAGRIATTDEAQIKKILDNTAAMVSNIPMQSTPAQTGMKVYDIVSQVSSVEDPYKAIKTKHIQQTKAIYPQLEELVKKSEDKLLTAIKVAIAGNIIDLGVNMHFDLVNDVQIILKQDFAILDYQAFKIQLEKADFVLYIGDNAGESVFDKILIKQLGKPVKYVVRSAPIINDVTMEDAIASGLDKVADIIESGSKSPGIILELSSPEFIELFQKASMVISKGQGNYEGLSDCSRTVFFLLKAKCAVISKHLGVAEGSIVMKEHIPQADKE